LSAGQQLKEEMRAGPQHLKKNVSRPTTERRNDDRQQHLKEEMWAGQHLNEEMTAANNT
jgi:hypothetical protein